MVFELYFSNEERRGSLHLTVPDDYSKKCYTLTEVSKLITFWRHPLEEIITPQQQIIIANIFNHYLRTVKNYEI